MPSFRKDRQNPNRVVIDASVLQRFEQAFSYTLGHLTSGQQGCNQRRYLGNDWRKLIYMFASHVP